MTEGLFAILLFVVVYKLTASYISGKRIESEERRYETDEDKIESPTFITKMGLDHNCEID